MCNPAYDVRRQNELEKTDHDVFEPKYMDGFCDWTKTLIKPGAHGHSSYSALQFFSWCQGPLSLTEEREFPNDGEEKTLR